MTHPTPTSILQSARLVLERLRTALRPGHRWFPLVVFALALTLGLLVGLSWLGMRRAQPAPTAASATTVLDPQHRPLPAPMAGDLSGLPAPTPGAPSAAHIVPAPAAAQSVAAEATSAVPAAIPNATPASSDNDSQAQIIERTQPEYPIEAVRANEEGEVRLQITLDALGNIEDVRVTQSSRSRGLDRAAMDAARKWKFRPAMHEGQPTSSTIEAPVDFHLDEH